MSYLLKCKRTGTYKLVLAGMFSAILFLIEVFGYYFNIFSVLAGMLCALIIGVLLIEYDVKFVFSIIFVSSVLNFIALGLINFLLFIFFYVSFPLFSFYLGKYCRLLLPKLFYMQDIVKYCLLSGFYTVVFYFSFIFFSDLFYANLLTYISLFPIYKVIIIFFMISLIFSYIADFFYYFFIKAFYKEFNYFIKFLREKI